MRGCTRRRRSSHRSSGIANVFLTESKNDTLPIGLRTSVFQFEQQYGWLTAGAVIVTIPALIVFLLAQRYLVSGLTRGGVKE